MDRCNKCNAALVLAVVNGQHTMICPNCMLKGHQLFIDMVKCQSCGLWYFGEIEKMCDCKKLKNEVISNECEN